MTMDEYERERGRFIEDHLAMNTTDDVVYGATIIKTGTSERERARMAAAAGVRFDRMVAERGEHIDASRYYQHIADSDLRRLKRTLGERKVISISIPTRMWQRLEHVPRGRRSACITRLIARGYLWGNVKDALAAVLEEGDADE